MAARYEIYQDTKDEWRWRYMAKNGEQISKASEGYSSKQNCKHSIDLMKGSGNDPVVDA